jgi:hypothetical protein
LPKGFERSFRLVLDRVDSGSAIPVVSRVVDEPMVPMLFHPTIEPDLFDRARDVVQRGIAAVSAGESLPDELTTDILARFNAFGRTLIEHESIVVAHPGSRNGAVYDRDIRRKLVLKAQATYEDDVNLLGEVRAADKDVEGFWLRTEDGRKLEVRTPPLFFPLALRSLETANLVRVRGTGLYDVDGSLVRVLAATDVSLAEEGDEQTRPGCPTPVEAQLEALRALNVGWYDESSPGYEASSLDWLAKLLKGLLDGFQLPRPYIYPSPDGLARAEWSAARWEVVTSFDLASRSAETMAARPDADEVRELTVRFSEPGGESKLGRFLTEYLAIQ